jgi:hypothetical protein
VIERASDRRSLIATLAVSKYLVMSQRVVIADMSAFVDFGSRYSNTLRTSDSVSLNR